jgi:hypothetical protein
VDIEHDEELKQARDDLASLFEAIVRAARGSGQLRTDVGLGDIGLMVRCFCRSAVLPWSTPRSRSSGAEGSDSG